MTARASRWPPRTGTSTDEGRGIAAGHERAVFERHVSTNGGTGVGLALARSLAEADGGRLDLVRLHPAMFKVPHRPAPILGSSA